jgi:NADH-quinone oxidoreductase subunit M
MSILLLVMLGLPLAGGVVAAALGAARLPAIRWLSLAATLVSLALAAIVAVDFGAHRTRVPQGTFQPEHVPGDPGVMVEGVRQPAHTTTWDLLHLGSASGNQRQPAIQFFIGIDGLNLWLIVLTALLLVSAVLVSWTSIRERGNEYYAWLLTLGTGMFGVFLSFDIILFYVFFELTLVPLFFLIGIWGGSQRQHAARKFFIYTLTGSLITLLGVLAVVLTCQNRTGELTFSIPRLVALVQDQVANATPEERGFWMTFQVWVFLALMAGFAVKVPLFPLHTWLPLAHVEAPTAGSVLLAGVLLKIGTYGFLRLCLPLAPDASLAVGAPLVGTLAVIGIIYGAFCSLAQDDIKKLIAYSSVSHLGFCMLGMFALNEAGLAGSLLQMINHGLSTGALFLLVGMLYERYHTRRMADYGGMAARLKLLGCFMVFIALSSIGLPGLNGFVGEALIFFGAYDFHSANVSGPALAALGSAGIVLGAWYMMTMLRRVFFGPVKEPEHDGHGLIADLNFRELAALVPIAVLCLAIGLYPKPLLDTARPDLKLVADMMSEAQKRAQPDALVRRVPSPVAEERPQ